MTEKQLVTFKVDRELLNDFNLAAELQHQNRAVYLRVLMVEAVKKATRLYPDAYRRGEA